MDYQNYVVRRLRELDAMRCAVQTTEQAIQVLTPEERLVVDRLYIHPEKGAVQALCELLELEPSSIYRRKDRAVEKLADVFFKREWTSGSDGNAVKGEKGAAYRYPRDGRPIPYENEKHFP